MARLESYAYSSMSGDTPEAVAVAKVRDHNKLRRWQHCFAEPKNREIFFPHGAPWEKRSFTCHRPRPAPVPKSITRSDVIAVRVPCERLDGTMSGMSYFKWKDIDLSAMLDYMRANNASLEDMQEAYVSLCRKWQASASHTFNKLRLSATRVNKVQAVRSEPPPVSHPRLLPPTKRRSTT